MTASARDFIPRNLGKKHRLLSVLRTQVSFKRRNENGISGKRIQCRQTGCLLASGRPWHKFMRNSDADATVLASSAASGPRMQCSDQPATTRQVAGVLARTFTPSPNGLLTPLVAVSTPAACQEGGNLESEHSSGNGKRSVHGLPGQTGSGPLRIGPGGTLFLDEIGISRPFPSKPSLVSLFASPGSGEMERVGLRKNVVWMLCEYFRDQRGFEPGRLTLAAFGKTSFV